MTLKKCYKSNEFFIKDFQNNISLSRNDFLLLLNKFIFFLRKKKINNCDVYIIDVKKNIIFSLYFFALLFCGKKIILNAKINKKKIKLNFKKICILKDNLISVNSKKFNYNVLAIERKIKIKYKNLDPRSIILTFSSGTTSRPKIIFQNLSKLIGNGKIFCKQIGLNKKNIFLNILPINYMGGYYNSLILSFINNSKLILLDKININFINDLEKIIKRYKVDTLWSTPSIANFITDRKLINFKKNIKNFLIGMDTVSDSLKRKIWIKYHIKALASYGMSETSFIASENNKSCLGNVGFILKKIKVKIDRNFDQDKGEILVKTPYLQECSENKLFKGWFKTGDIGKIHSDGSLSILGRKKDIIIKDGKNISPLYIERIIKRYENVDEAVIIGIKKNYTEKIILFIKLKTKKKLNKELLYKFCYKNLDKLSVPDEIYQINNFEKTVSGKIIRKKLKVIYEKKYLL